MTNAAVVTCATGNASFRRCKGGTLLNKRSAGDSVRSSALVGRHQRGSAGRPRRVSHVVGAKSAFALNTANSSSSSARGALIQSGSRGVVHAATASKSSSPLGWCSGGSSGGRSSTSAVVVRAGAEPGSAAASPPPSSDENLGDTKSTSNSKGLPSWFPMHDFCLTLPWGLFVALGGVAGFAIAGSTKSLIFGGGFGSLLMALGGLSLKKWKAGGSSTVYTASSLLISAALSAVMGKKWMAGASFVPSGVITVGAVFMCITYLHNMLTGGNPPRSKSE